ncbi:MAG: hypothetical protein COA78_19705 [Blastopirellula sp.]|nr:MAG: hypothetical protein COA78_19705 [Blastopirellula sp.]
MGLLFITSAIGVLLIGKGWASPFALIGLVALFRGLSSKDWPDFWLGILVAMLYMAMAIFAIVVWDLG